MYDTAAASGMLLKSAMGCRYRAPGHRACQVGCKEESWLKRRNIKYGDLILIHNDISFAVIEQETMIYSIMIDDCSI